MLSSINRHLKGHAMVDLLIIVFAIAWLMGVARARGHPPLLWGLITGALAYLWSAIVKFLMPAIVALAVAKSGPLLPGLAGIAESFFILFGAV